MPSSIAQASVAILLSPVLAVRLISRRLLGIGAVAGGRAPAPALPRAGGDCRRVPPRAPDAAHGAHRAGPTTRHESTASRAFDVAYLLSHRVLTQPNDVWAMDITHIPMARGFVYLVVALDWASRRVLSWRVSIGSAVSFRLYA